MSGPRVSLIIPARDAARTLAQTLGSVARQTLSDFEALIVDDGSRDATREIAQAYADADARFHLLDAEDEGVSAARNSALVASRGEYVAFLDADDLIPPDSLAARAAWLKANPNAQLVSCMWDVIGPNGELLAPGMGRLTAPRRFDTAFEFPVHIGAVMGAGSLLRQHRFDPARAYGEDHKFLIDMLRDGATLHPHHHVVLHYRWSAASAVGANAEAHCDALISLLESYLGPEGWPEDSVRPRQLALLRRLAVRHALNGDDAERTAARCDALSAWAHLDAAHVDPDSLWVVAARAFLKPARSAELGECVCNSVGALLALANRADARFAASLRRFVDQALAAAAELAA